MKNVMICAILMVLLGAAFPAHADTGWRQRDKLTASDAATDDYFGQSVSISGDHAIVAAYGDDSSSGSAYILKWDGETWVEQQKLTASDGAADDQFGKSVSISGDLAIVGAWYDDDNGSESGSAYIFKWDGETWVEQQKLTASDAAADDVFGYSVSIISAAAGAGSGDLVIVGAVLDDDNGSKSGSAYIFKWDGETWVEQQKLTASDGAAIDYFGQSVSISGDHAFVGANGNDDNGSWSGSAYIFKWDGETWVEQQKLDGAANEQLGCSVSISGDRAIVGAYGSTIRNGSAYIFKWDGETWVEQQKLAASDGTADDYFGLTVSISGDLAIVGAWYDDDNGSESGSAYIFKWDGETWVEQQKLTASDAAADDWFGYSVSISGDRAIVGAKNDDDNGADSGSAYIFGTGELTILAPNGGEELIAGQTATIEWSSTLAEDANVVLEYSTNNGQDWNDVDVVANTGAYDWSVPQVTSNQCLVRITDVSDSNLTDTSDDVFTIYVCQLSSLAQAADLDDNCTVDFIDFSIWSLQWLSNGNPFDPDCTSCSIYDGLIAHYKLDATSGAVVDETGNNDGVNHGATRGVAGKAGNAFDFDGIDDYVDLSLNSTDASWTISLWMNSTDTSEMQYILDARPDPVEGIEGPLIRTLNGNLNYNAHHLDDYPIATSANACDGNWHHIVVCADGTSANLYFDSVNTLNPTVTARDFGGDDVSLGAIRGSGGAAEYHGLIDEIRIYNRALTGEDVLVLYNEIEPPVEENIYHVDGEYGSNANDGLSRATAFETIQKGIDTAADGNVVLVWPGIYSEQIFYDGKAITVMSADYPAVIEAPWMAAVSFIVSEGPGSVLQNFVIKGSMTAIACNNESSPTLKNLTIVDNDFGIAAYENSAPNIVNCILWGNQYGDLYDCEARYSCVQTGSAGVGNITLDPLFADFAGGNYHLLSEFGRYVPAFKLWSFDDATSPCIDTGDVSHDFSDERMPNGGRINMGVYGGTAYASMGQWVKGSTAKVFNRSFSNSVDGGA